jgi:catechol 2,3-dioxygenase-like lactoylglutathione lyase family enzyme
MSVPPIAGVHHVKLPVSDLVRSREWYESVLGLQVRTEFRDDDGVVRGVAGTLTEPSGEVVLGLALRQNAEVSAGLDGFDPLSLSLVEHADLQRWADHVVALGFERPQTHAAVLRLHDPDGHEIRLFSPEH